MSDPGKEKQLLPQLMLIVVRPEAAPLGQKRVSVLFFGFDFEEASGGEVHRKTKKKRDKDEINLEPKLWHPILVQTFPNLCNNF